MRPLSLVLALCAGPALADSCWLHNGSLMRLTDDGDARAFLYESPRPALRAAGVGAGTLLFDGARRGDWYSGTARVFSAACLGDPLEYFVEGPVTGGATRVELRGEREVFDANCFPTGRWTTDVLVFTYSHDC